MAQANIELRLKISELCNGKRSSKEIAAILGTSAKYVQSTMLKLNLPRLKQGGPTGKRNGAFAGGRRIDKKGYAWRTAPLDHPYAHTLPGKNFPKIGEHRLAMETHLGRYLKPSEVVDHKDGLTLHNDPKNLRLFANNADYLRATISGQVPKWSLEGWNKMNKSRHQRAACAKVNTHREVLKSGEIRLRQILLLWLSLGKDSPFLLGTLRWLEKAGIDDFSDRNLRLHLEVINQKWADTHHQPQGSW